MSQKSRGMYKEYLKMAVINARKEQNRSKASVANMLNMSLPTYYKFERDGKISMEDYALLCQILNLRVVVVPDKYISNL